MGQEMYWYQAPTGYPDKGEYWVNTGSLINRLNFNLNFALNKINGVKVDILKLNNNHEPKSIENAF
jgi:hypothetical protein